MKRRNLLAALLVVTALIGCNDSDNGGTQPTEPDDTPQLRVGSGTFVFRGSPGSANRPVTVFYHRPLAATSDSPILFVMHGTDRNGGSYRNAWVPEAESKRFILIVPEFSKEHYPNTRQYHTGNVLNASGAPIDSTEWSYVTIEALFDEVVKRTRSNRTGYNIYGHSAGGQFVHRMLWMMPGARIDHAVPANAGWYTLPDPSAKWAVGLGGTGSSASFEERLRAATSRKVTLLLGEADTSTTDPNLPTSTAAMAQGRHRFERGNFFFEDVKSTAARNGVPFEWNLVTVPGVGHSNRRMAPAAAAAIDWQ